MSTIWYLCYCSSLFLVIAFAIVTTTRLRHDVLLLYVLLVFMFFLFRSMLGWKFATTTYTPPSLLACVQMVQLFGVRTVRVTENVPANLVFQICRQIHNTLLTAHSSKRAEETFVPSAEPTPDGCRPPVDLLTQKWDGWNADCFDKFVKNLFHEQQNRYLVSSMRA